MLQKKLLKKLLELKIVIELLSYVQILCLKTCYKSISFVQQKVYFLLIYFMNCNDFKLCVLK